MDIKGLPQSILALVASGRVSSSLGAAGSLQNWHTSKSNNQKHSCTGKSRCALTQIMLLAPMM